MKISTSNTFVNPFDFNVFSPLRRRISIPILAEMKERNDDELTNKIFQAHRNIYINVKSTYGSSFG